MIQFGDDLLFTSAIFDQMPIPASVEEACLVGLYSAFFNEMARGPSLLRRERYA
jgi:hypothetical protein